MSPAHAIATLAVACVATAVAGCADRAPPLADCAGDLSGVYQRDGDDGPLRYHLVPARDPERGSPIWELYPMFDDRPRDLADGVRTAPSVIDVERPFRGHPGGWSRRYERGGDLCVVRTPARLTRCEGQRLELTVRPPQPPTDLADCTTAPDAPDERWLLTRE